jgi:hypothetical protein
MPRVNLVRDLTLTDLTAILWNLDGKGSRSCFCEDLLAQDNLCSLWLKTSVAGEFDQFLMRRHY